MHIKQQKQKKCDSFIGESHFILFPFFALCHFVLCCPFAHSMILLFLLFAFFMLQHRVFSFSFVRSCLFCSCCCCCCCCLYGCAYSFVHLFFFASSFFACIPLNQNCDFRFRCGFSTPKVCKTKFFIHFVNV